MNVKIINKFIEIKYSVSNVFLSRLLQLHGRVLVLGRSSTGVKIISIFVPVTFAICWKLVIFFIIIIIII